MNNSRFTNWSQNIYDIFRTKVCNTFVLSGNIGDYALEFYNLTDYLERLFIAKDGFNMDDVIVYDSEKGGYSRKPNNNQKRYSFSEICQKMETENSGKVAYVIRYPQSIIPNCDFSHMKPDQESNCIRLHRALTSSNFFRQNSLAIIIADSPNDINPMFLSSSIKSMNIEIPLPSAEDRRAFINLSSQYAMERECGFGINVSVDELVRLTAGLTRLSIEDLIIQGTKCNPITKDSVLQKKAELINREYSNIIELLDASDLSLDDFAGQDNIKSYFKEVVIDAIANDNTSIIPKGVLLMGPPGTGKSYFAKCLAGSAGINFVEFKMSKILDKYVGQAEKNLEKAFAVFRALAPVGVFIDEMDQALSRGDKDSHSVNKNLFGMFLAELSKSENRGKIIWLGATNYPNKIDEALKRTGRFDKKIPFFAPSATERKLVFAKRIQKVSPNSKNINYNDLAANTEGFTQAEIEGVVVKALELSIRRGMSVINNELLMLALDYMSSTQNANIKEMEDIALIECNDIEFLSPEYISRKKQLNK